MRSFLQVRKSLIHFTQ